MPRKKQVPYSVIRKKVDQYVSEHINDNFYDRRTKKLKEQSSESLLKKTIESKEPLYVTSGQLRYGRETY